tara:strand:+ start:986 stop:1432 length:447 start_codon:yes stop_codon:yes gene_type:complete
MAISSQVLELDRKKRNQNANLRVLSKPRPWIWGFLSGMILLIVLGIFVRVGFSALVVNNQRSLDRTITMISDASDVNRAHRFNISELESAQRIYKIAFGSPEELVEGDLHGLGMITPSQVKYLTASGHIHQERWKDTAVSEPDSGVNG